MKDWEMGRRGDRERRPYGHPVTPSSRRHNDPQGPMDFVYGRRPVWEVLRAGKRSLHKLWMVPGTSGGVVEEILSLSRARGVPIEWVRREILDKKVGGHHQGVAAKVSATSFLELEDFLKGLSAESDALVLALDEIEDPQNVGAILRNAGFFGVTAVMVPRWRSAPVGETALRASSGAAEHVPQVRVRNLVQALDEMKEYGFQVWGADMGGEMIGRISKGKRLALVLGSEGKGLRRLVREHCDKIVGIAGAGKVDSLNVASASAIFLYELIKVGNQPR
jgi:23S rRNA (guanosine2251-2'-O)-methyltransferase